MSRNILDELASRSITAEEARVGVDRAVDEFHERAGPEIREAVCMTESEYTAYLHGATLEALARWRRSGWPSECLFCGQPVRTDVHGWFACEMPSQSGTWGIIHAHCLKQMPPV